MDRFENLEPREWLQAMLVYIADHCPKDVLMAAGFEINRLQHERELDEFDLD